MITAIEGVLVGFVGRPILLLTKWLMWPLLFFGLYFGGVGTYNPRTHHLDVQPTVIPFIVGLVLFCIGLTVKRYDAAFREYLDLTERLDQGPTGHPFIDPPIR